MATRPAGGRPTRTPRWLILAVLATLIATTLPVSGFAGASVPPSGEAALRAPALAPQAPSPPVGPRPAGATNFSLGQSYESTDLAPPNATDAPCLTDNYGFFIQQSCYPETQSPSLVTLANGEFGVGYSVYTTVGPLCNATANSTNLTSWTSSNVAWAHSLSNASAWSPATVLGTPSCRWPSAAEPTFATGSGGVVDGAYIVSNQSINSSGPYGSQPLFPPDWSAPSGDAIAFVHSANNGTTWSNVSVVPNVTAAVRPQIAVFGDTVYIVYINTNNSTATYPGGGGFGPFPALAVDLVVSTNSGTSWSAPRVLPGENAAMGNWSSSPSIAVNILGAVSVAYATNRTCLASCHSYYPPPTYGDQIVVASSSANGSSWSAPRVAGNWTGELYTETEYADAYYNSYAFPWMTSPQTSIAYGSSPSSIYVAYSGTFVKSGPYAYLDWVATGVFAAYSANSGGTWSNATVAANFSQSNYDNYYNPAITVSGSTAYVAYVVWNETYCYGSTGCPGFDGLVSSWVASSPNGLTWSSNMTAASSYRTPSFTGGDFMGWESSVTISSNGTPVTATTLPGASSSSFSSTGPPYYYVQDFWTNVSIGYVDTGPTTTVTFDENNLSAGTVWGIAFEGFALTTNLSSIVVAGVPIGLSIPLAILTHSVSGYRSEFTEALSVPSTYEFPGPTVVYANFTIEYGLQFWVLPTTTTNVEQIRAYIGGTFYYVECFDGYTYAGPAFPWYFPAGVTETFQGGSDPPITYWNGTGIGSYTGGGTEINITMGGPVNETGWAGTYGVSTEGFYATGLPSTSRYTFLFAGSNHTSPASNWTYVANVATGGYTVSDITANASAPGWEYFGSVVNGSSTVVVPAQPTVDLGFSLVDLAVPVGTVTFHAGGLGAGTVWSVGFNGTDYSSATPWLNVSTRPGTFAWTPGAAVSANGSAGYTPVGAGATLSVTTGETVNLSYTAAYRVSVVSGLGGSTTLEGSEWLAANATANFTATPVSADAFGGWTGTGVGAYSGPNATAVVTAGGPITETASFFPLPSSRFNVTFDESGIPSGAWWTVDLDGFGYASNGSSLTVSNLLSCAAGTAGQYLESVPIAYNTNVGATRYVPVNPPSQFCTNGGTIQPLTFATQYQVTLSATLGGTAYVADGSEFSTSSLWANSTDTVQLSASPATGVDTFAGWTGSGPGSYTGPELDPTIVPGGPVAEVATFAPVVPPVAPTYTVEFSWAVGYVAGATWDLRVGTTAYAGVTPNINVSGLSATTYTVVVGVATSVNDTIRWIPALATFPLLVTQNGTKTVPFAPPSYWVSIAGSTGGTESPSSGWFESGAALALSATPDLGETFVGWTGTGTGSYSGNASTPNATVGSPLTEFATFRATGSTGTTTTTSSIWSNASIWALLGAVGLLAGLVVGFAIRRSRGGSGGSPDATPQAGAPTGNSEPGSSGGGQ
ncbi:MAG: hypothetical protein L3K00_02450 [Thermoplasmata archaeon]|nr:hypothetical protein [Thermoplasmata archaeon]